MKIIIFASQFIKSDITLFWTNELSVVMTPWPHLIWFFFNAQEYFQVHSSHQQTISTHGWRVICKIHRPLCPDSQPVLTLGSHISLPGVKCISSCIAAPSCLSDKFEELGRGRVRASWCSLFVLRSSDKLWSVLAWLKEQHPVITWFLLRQGGAGLGFKISKKAPYVWLR